MAILTQFNSSPATDLAGLAIVGQIVVSQPTVTLSLPTANKTVGTTDTVTATITNPGGSIDGQTVNFSVTGANTASGSGVTDASGQTTFTYTGTNPGADTITATYGTATVNWSAPASTTISTSLSGGGSQGATITVPPGTPVTDSASLTGTNVATAGGTVTYSVYSNSACTVSAGTGGTVSVTNGTVPNSNPVTLSTSVTYYWVASYSGDSNDGPSTSPCSAEKETVAAPGIAPVVDDSCNGLGTTSVTNKDLVTSAPNELVVAYVSADGPASGGQTVTVSGSGLTWTRVAQENGALGDTEVWVGP